MTLEHPFARLAQAHHPAQGGRDQHPEPAAVPLHQPAILLSTLSRRHFSDRLTSLAADVPRADSRCPHLPGGG
jgi:hypothetical protein